MYSFLGESSPRLPRRRRACDDDASCASINGELLGSTGCCTSNDSLPCDSRDGEKNVIQVEALIHPIPAEAADLGLPDTTGTSPDPMPLECSPAQAQPECPDSSTTMQAQVSISEEKPSVLEGGVESGQQSEAPGNSTSSEPLS